MKALYIHGLYSSPLPQKVDILKKYFNEVFAPKIDWDNEEERVNLLKTLIELIKREKITHVIGSSMGGQMAFHLAGQCAIKGLCFNPAFGYRYKDLGFEFTPVIKNIKEGNSEILITLGTKDDVVDPNKTIAILERLNIKDQVKVEWIEMGHSIDFEIFENQLKKII